MSKLVANVSQQKRGNQMLQDVIKNLKTTVEALDYEAQFLAARQPGETAQNTANRLYCMGRDDTARAYELLDDKFPNLFTQEIC